MKNTDKDVIKRKAYYGFSKNYPGRVGSGKYVIGESRTVQRREFLRRILIIFLLLCVFIAGFIVTSVFLNISEKPINEGITQAAADFTQ